MNDQNKHFTQKPSNQNLLLTLRETISGDWQKILNGCLKDGTRVAEITKNFIILVETHYRREHSPFFYADQLKITKRYLREVCQQTIGFAPRFCIQTRLMLDSSMLLKESNKSIKEIAFGLGFEYPEHFSRFFKAYSGLAPQTYRDLS